MAHKENNKAQKACQDNKEAFHFYKRKDLFPGAGGRADQQRTTARNKAVVKAFKVLQDSVTPCNWK